MPLYEYRCETCAEKEEKLEGFSAPTEHDCPRCGAAKGMRRLISLSAFNLAGGGWDAEGYSKPAPAKPAAAPAGCPGGCGCHAAKS